MASSPEMAVGVRPGDILAGKYRVERVLGQGGMGIVVAAHHIQLDEKVALKFLLPEALGSAEAVARFVREARAAVKIKSEHVARVSDVGTLETGAPYMVMEYLEGGDLSDWIKQKGPLPVEQAIEFVLQACVAVADAHALGIVHRDLKPANLFCVRRSDGQLSVKVLDFGISKVTDPASSGMAATKTSALMGSPLYMSPEQMRSSKDVDAQTDIWALGVILFELLSGRTAFVAETVTELAIRVANEPAPPVRAFRPDAPPGLEVVIARCLEKDKRRRYKNVAELAFALLPFAPPRAKVSVDRISGIIQAAGLSTGALAASASHVEESALPSAGQIPASTLPPVGRTTTGTSARKGAAVGATIAGVVVAVGGLTAVLLLKRPAHRDDALAEANSSAAPGVSPATAEARVDPPKPVAPTPPPPAATVVVPAAPPPPAHASPTESPPTGKKKPAGGAPSLAASPASPAPVAPSAAAAAGAAAPAAAAPAACNPPYYFDARGNRVFKPECL